jgi:Tol biopolymer transport system component
MLEWCVHRTVRSSELGLPTARGNGQTDGIGCIAWIKSMNRFLGALLAVALGLAPQAGAQPQRWNVEETGQPYRDVRVSTTEGTWMSLDVSPDGRTIAFDMLGDIYVIPAAGGDARALHAGPAMQRSPRFSPDGRKLLYISDADGADNLWISNADGSAPGRVTAQTVENVNGPAWGADGSFVAAAKMYADDHRLHGSELRLWDLSGGAGRVLVPAPQNTENVHEASFSPDGRYLYYTEKVSPPTVSRVYIDANHSNYAIMRRELETGATEELIRGFGGATTAELSRSGKRLAFVRRVADKTVLFAYDVETREQRPVFDRLDRDAQADFIGQGNYYPRYGWFPDNRHVAIWAGGKLWKVDMDGGRASEIPFRVVQGHRVTEPVRFTHDLAPEQFTVRAIRQLAVSRRGDTLYFNALGRLWRKQGNAAPQRLSHGTALEFEPAVSPDGRRIAYVEWADETGGVLKLADADGKAARTLLASGGVLRSPAFSPDGRKLVYKIDYGDRCLGGHQSKPGLYWMNLTDGQSHYIGPPGNDPMFAPDGTRVYYTVVAYDGENTTTALESVNLAGADKRVHAKTRDADTSEIRISPDLKWIAFRDHQQYWVTAYRETGIPLALSAASEESLAKRVSAIGGYALTWSGDSSRLVWAIGDKIASASPSEAFSAGWTPLRSGSPVGLVAKSDMPAGEIAFVGGRIITMKGEEVIENGTVLVRGNRIAAIGAAADVAVPASAKVVDIAGKTVMPGLVDMHGHIDNCYYTSSGLMPQKQSARYADLAYGITTNYDPYSSELPTYSMSEMTRTGDMVGPRAIDSGLVAFGRSGKGDNAYIPISSYEDAVTLMARKSALGGQIVKSYRQPMRSQRQMLVKAGRDAGVMVDVEGESSFYNNITMLTDGNTNLQHNMPIPNYYDDVVQLMAGARASHTPTLVLLFGELAGENYWYQNSDVWKDPKAQAFVQVTTSGYSPLGTPYGAPPYVRGMTTIHAAEELWDIGFRSVARSMKRLDDAGVRVNVGSHGQFSGLAQHWEMWLLAQGGMSNHRVLRAATMNGAETLGIDGQIGSLEPGKLADLIVLDENPLSDIRNTNSVRHTMVNGRLYDSYAMDEIGNRPRPRGKFFWEVGAARGGNIIDWKSAWAHQ